MHVNDDLLPVNEFSRSGRKLAECRSIILHWTGTPMQGAREVQRFFTSRSRGTLGYGSAHYAVDFSGEIIRMIPDSEVAYHCGTDKKDPVSGRVYTDWARRMLGPYASEKSSPNNCTIGIELCTVDTEGHFREATIEAAIELTAHLCRVHGVKPENIGTHHMVVGWKDCPRLWTTHPELFAEVQASVKGALS